MRRFAILLVLIALVGCAAPDKAPSAQIPVGSQPVVSEEAAVKAAKSADPEAQVDGWAGWQVRLEGTAWVVEAVHFDGAQWVFHVAADQYPPKLLRLDKAPGKYVSRDVAVRAALVGTKNAEVKAVRFDAKHRPEQAAPGVQEVAVWIADLVSTSDQRPVGQVIVDAVTGRVLSASSAPSGQ